MAPKINKNQSKEDKPIEEDIVVDEEEKVKSKGEENAKVKKTVKKQSSSVDDQDEILLDANKISKTSKKQQKKQNLSNELFNDEDIDYRNVLINYDFTKNKTLPKITKYEKALLIGKRAKQIEEGSNPNVKVLAGQSAIEIAEEELRQRVLPLIIKRPLGNGLYEYWRPKDMEVIMD